MGRAGSSNAGSAKMTRREMTQVSAVDCEVCPGPEGWPKKCFAKSQEPKVKLGVCMLWTEMRGADFPLSENLMLGLAPMTVGGASGSGATSSVSSSRVRTSKAALIAGPKPTVAKRRPSRRSELLIAAR